MPGGNVGGAIQSFFNPNDPLVAQRRSLQLAGVGDILQGGTGASAQQGLAQLRQQQQAQELLSGLLGGGQPSAPAMAGQPAQPLATPPAVSSSPLSSDPIVQGAQDAIDQSDPTLALIRGFEGFRETPYWDVNAFRTGYGSDTITTADGQVIPVDRNTRVTREDAERDLARRVRTEFAPRARQDVTPQVYDSLNPQQQAALNSLAYNYGEVPERVARVARTGNIQQTAEAIANLSGDNEGINAQRRQREAQIFAGGAPAGGGQQIDQQRLLQILQSPAIDPSVKQLVLQRFGGAGGQEPTSAIQNYEFARSQGYQGSFVDFQNEQRRAGATNVNVGPQGQQFPNPPSGTVYRRDPQTGQIAINEEGLPTLVPLPGSEQALEAEATEEQQRLVQEQTSRATGVVLEDIASARELAEQGLTTGLGGSLAGGVPGTPAYDLNQLTETIRANVGFDRLQQMREASPTGGALGAITERELSTLQAVLGSLDTSQSREQFLRNLNRLEEIYKDIERKAAAYPNANQFGFQQSEQAQGGEWQDLGDGIRIRLKQ